MDAESLFNIISTVNNIVQGANYILKLKSVENSFYRNLKY